MRDDEIRDYLGEFIDDPAIVAALRSDVHKGYPTLHDAYAERLHGYALITTGDGPLARDITRETLLLAATNIQRLRTARQLRPWLFALAREQARAATEPGTGAPADPSHASPAYASLSQLTLDDRVALALSLMDDLNEDDLGIVLRLSPEEARRQAESALRLIDAEAGAGVEEAATASFPTSVPLPRGFEEECRQEVSRLLDEGPIPELGPTDSLGFPRPRSAADIEHMDAPAPQDESDGSGQPTDWLAEHLASDTESRAREPMDPRALALLGLALAVTLLGIVILLLT